MKISIIITTYNSQEWLKKVLLGFSVQTVDDFEIIIADDGSTYETKAVIDSFSARFTHPIIHVWHEDNGFQKSLILNKAILKSNAEYLLFTDGDCIPRNDFVATHLRFKEEGFFLSGGYFKLPMTVSKLIKEEDIINQNCFSISWLKGAGLPISFKLIKLIKNYYFNSFMNWLTPTKRTWNGHNSSGFKKDIIAVNGFNNDMKYGGLDRELGERLDHLGLLSKQIRYSAICLHLDHERGYASPEIWKKNNAIRAFNRKNKVIKIENGITSVDSPKM
ncbi:glycosyltransferase family 2 protein [Flavobacterium sp. j3]|uniref:Glycosyltransferase family 2 protein n=1 Tax=Flavobacterium aureirubrum TaxID=3133147 RepID=A0ABU9N2B6_9FLAO